MVEIERLRLDYVSERGTHTAVRDLDLRVEAAEFFTLLGPSGCGKTSTLRAIAGLERPSAGAIRIAGKPVLDIARSIDVPTHERPLSMVFQSYAVWPHMSVAENVAFPLDVARVPRTQSRERVAEVLALVGLADYAQRGATQLSGGQQQRVAIARGLARRTPLLLLDEPLSNLDAKLRADMRIELRGIIKRAGVAAIYVTHDQDEALMLSDRIAVMDGGRLVECGPPEQLYRRPRSLFTATFLGAAEVWRIESRADSRAGTTIGPLVVVDLGAECTHVGIRPEAILLHDGSAAGVNRFPGRIVRSAFSGRNAHYDLVLDGSARALQVIAAPSPLRPEGSAVTVELPAAALMGLVDCNGRIGSV